MLDRSKILIVALVGLGVVAAGGAMIFRYYQGRRALALWGAEHASRIRNAERVTLLRLSAEEDASAIDQMNISGKSWNITSQIEISQTRDLDAVRRVFVEDAYFDWNPANSTPVTWAFAVRFEDAKEATTLLIEAKRIELVEQRRGSQSRDVSGRVMLLNTGVDASLYQGVLPSIRSVLDRAKPQ
jgi:hypothetical protein